MRRLLLACCCALLLGACRLDVTAELVIGEDGTGELVVMAVADAEVVEQAPGLERDLRFDDAIAAGWTVDGPEATDEGGLRLTLGHPVGSAAEANNLLASLGPPFGGVTLTQTTVEDTTTNELRGELRLTGGFDAFADADLLAAVGGSPFADRLAASSASPAASMSFTFRADLQGDVESTTGEARDGALSWEAPLDGSSADVATRTVHAPTAAPWWARPLATIALVLLVAWVVAAAAFIAYVVAVRRHKLRRRWGGVRM